MSRQYMPLRWGDIWNIVYNSRIVRKYGLAILIPFAISIYTCAVCGINGAIVRNNTRIEVEAECAAKYEQQLQDYKNQQQAAQLLTGDASRAAANREKAELMAKASYPVFKLGFSGDDIRTYDQVMVNREHSADYPGSIKGVVEQEGQIMGYSPDNPVIEDLFLIAMEVLEANDDHWVTSDAFVFVDWSTGKMVARDTYITGITTNYWSWGK